MSSVAKKDTVPTPRAAPRTNRREVCSVLKPSRSGDSIGRVAPPNAAESVVPSRTFMGLIGTAGYLAEITAHLLFPLQSLVEFVSESEHVIGIFCFY